MRADFSYGPNTDVSTVRGDGRHGASIARTSSVDFTSAKIAKAPAARTVRAERDGVLPDGFFATTNLPTYIKNPDGTWAMPREPRMDGCLVRAADGTWFVREGRRVVMGDEVVVGLREDGSEGVLVHANGFAAPDGAAGDFHFMQSQVSREKPIDYRALADRLVEEKRRGGYIIWVTGPALVHSRARDNMVWFIRNGFVQALLAGNAVAVRWQTPGGRESFALAVESRQAGDSAVAERISADVRSAVTAAIGVRPAVVTVLPVGSLPKTPSGKLKRTAAAALIG